jgi:ATPase subunit of ABC transporter with duplicated ATPase domains
VLKLTGFHCPELPDLYDTYVSLRGTHYGAVKTTLFRMITGEENPDKGEFTVGESLQIGYVEYKKLKTA